MSDFKMKSPGGRNISCRGDGRKVAILRGLGNIIKGDISLHFHGLLVGKQNTTQTFYPRDCRHYNITEVLRSANQTISVFLNYPMSPKDHHNWRKRSWPFSWQLFPQQARKGRKMAKEGWFQSVKLGRQVPHYHHLGNSGHCMEALWGAGFWSVAWEH